MNLTYIHLLNLKTSLKSLFIVWEGEGGDLGQQSGIELVVANRVLRSIENWLPMNCQRGGDYNIITEPYGRISKISLWHKKKVHRPLPPGDQYDRSNLVTVGGLWLL